MMKKPDMLHFWLTCVAFLAMLCFAGCGSGGGGLECEGGDFYLDGHLFTSCDQCSNPDSCDFSTSTHYSYDSYGNVSSQSGTTTAHCNGKSATVRFSGNNYTCE
jgi:hypothetical protein